METALQIAKVGFMMRFMTMTMTMMMMIESRWCDSAGCAQWRRGILCSPNVTLTYAVLLIWWSYRQRRNIGWRCPCQLVPFFGNWRPFRSYYQTWARHREERHHNVSRSLCRGAEQKQCFSNVSFLYEFLPCKWQYYFLVNSSSEGVFQWKKKLLIVLFSFLLLFLSSMALRRSCR